MQPTAPTSTSTPTLSRVTQDQDELDAILIIHDDFDATPDTNSSGGMAIWAVVLLILFVVWCCCCLFVLYRMMYNNMEKREAEARKNVPPVADAQSPSPADSPEDSFVETLGEVPQEQIICAFALGDAETLTMDASTPL